MVVPQRRMECSITRCDLEFNVSFAGGNPGPAIFKWLFVAKRIISVTTYAMYQQAAHVQVGAPCVNDRIMYCLVYSNSRGPGNADRCIGIRVNTVCALNQQGTAKECVEAQWSHNGHSLAMRAAAFSPHDQARIRTPFPAQWPTPLSLPVSGAQRHKTSMHER